jgi:hypothetical protein
MPLSPSSCVARFATKMHPDTIAILFCLILVTLGIGHTIVSSGVVPKSSTVLVRVSMNYTGK